MSTSNVNDASDPASAPPQAETPRKWRDLKERTIYGTAMALTALVCVLLGGYFFMAMLFFIAVIAAQEWYALTPQFSRKYLPMGLVYIVVPCLCLIALRDFPLEDGKSTPAAVIALLTIVWASDIGCYFAGKLFGKKKLAPHVSPNKTWEGLYGGIAASALAALIAMTYAPVPSSFIGAIAIGAILAVVGQIGDIFESGLKRQAGVKDSGNLIPGHGGVLDRIDALLFAAPVFTLYALLSA